MDLDLATEVAKVVGESQDTESLARPLLKILHRLTGLESTYLTEVALAEDEQRIMFSENFGDLEIPEGLAVEWSDTLCRRALSTGIRMTSNVPETFPGSDAAEALGLRTYVSVPVTDSRDVVLGTLCGASGSAAPQNADVMNVMELFARLIADQWKRDNALAAADERAREAERKLSNRAAELAESEHKLKSPLTVIRGWASMLNDPDSRLSPEMSVEAIARIHTAAETLTQQLDELIEAQRQAATSAPLQIASVDVNGLLKRVRDELSGLSKTHVITADIDQLITVQSNESTLWQILSHLGENAVKYSPDGGHVTLGVRHDGNAVVVTVADDGPGLPKDVDVFQAFVRGNEEATAGSGLGLHIVKTLTQGLGGTLWVNTATGKGTTFFIRLPVDSDPSSN